jgi:hypothetical protein
MASQVDACLKCAADRLADQRGVSQRREVREPDTVGVHAGEVVSHCQRQPSLADPARADERQEAAVVASGQAHQLGELPLAPDERVRRGGQVAPHPNVGGLHRQCRVVTQDRRLESAKLRPCTQAELAPKGAVCPPVGRQSVVLAAGPVQGEHQLRVEAFTGRVLGDQPLELGDHLAGEAVGEIGIDPQLQRFEPLLLQREHQVARTRFAVEVGQRAATPERQALT